MKEALSGADTVAVTGTTQLDMSNLSDFGAESGVNKLDMTDAGKAVTVKVTADQIGNLTTITGAKTEDTVDDVATVGTTAVAVDAAKFGTTYKIEGGANASTVKVAGTSAVDLHDKIIGDTFTKLDLGSDATGQGVTVTAYQLAKFTGGITANAEDKITLNDAWSDSTNAIVASSAEIVLGKAANTVICADSGSKMMLLVWVKTFKRSHWMMGRTPLNSMELVLMGIAFTGDITKAQDTISGFGTGDTVTFEKVSAISTKATELPDGTTNKLTTGTVYIHTSDSTAAAYASAAATVLANCGNIGKDVSILLVDIAKDGTAASIFSITGNATETEPVSADEVKLVGQITGENITAEDFLVTA